MFLFKWKKELSCEEFKELFTAPKSPGCGENIAKLVRPLQNGLSEFMRGGGK